MTSKRILITTFGSFGDLHPYMAIALELKARGHQLVMATSEIYREKITSEGLGFHPVRPDLPPPEEAGPMIAKLMDARTGTEHLFTTLLMPTLRDSYEDLRVAVRGADLLVTHMITFAGPILARQTGIPWVSTILAPISFFSAHELPVLPGAPALAAFRHLPPATLQPLVRLAKRRVESWITPLYELRAELGLPRGAHPVFEGQHSPELVLALFSSVLGAPQPDWPEHTRQTGFCFYDRKDEARVAPKLMEFLDSGEAPIVFTLGSSAVFDARNFYRDSAEAARRLGRRAVLLIGHEDNLPESLPAGVVAFDYAPFSEILPRAAAIVHQGGAGTTGQALRAGKPMLIMPYSHDQPDNGARVTRLGVGRTLPRHRYNATRAAAELGKLLNDASYAAKAAEIGRRVQAEDGPKAACDAIEERLRASTAKA